MSGASACGACDVCLFLLLCFRKGSELSMLMVDTARVCIKWFERESAVEPLACLARAQTTVVTIYFCQRWQVHAELLSFLKHVTNAGLFLHALCVICMYVSMCSRVPSLVAWQLEAVVMKLMSVQVCSESPGMLSTCYLPKLEKFWLTDPACAYTTMQTSTADRSRCCCPSSCL